jgi:hypothetical protein
VHRRPPIAESTPATDHDESRERVEDHDDGIDPDRIITFVTYV